MIETLVGNNQLITVLNIAFEVTIQKITRSKSPIRSPHRPRRVLGLIYRERTWVEMINLLKTYEVAVQERYGLSKGDTRIALFLLRNNLAVQDIPGCQTHKVESKT